MESLYTIVWLNAMHYKVREGRKELIGMYVSEREGANFWLSALTDMKARGVQDILMACIDNLNGLAEVIASIFPKVEVQSYFLETLIPCYLIRSYHLVLI